MRAAHSLALILVIVGLLFSSCGKDQKDESSKNTATPAITSAGPLASKENALAPSHSIEETQTPLLKKAPTYFEVRRNIQAYIGKKVAWIAKNVTFSHSTNTKTGEETMTYVYLARDEEGNFFADYPFLCTHPGGWFDVKHTPAAANADKIAGDKGIRLIRGTVKGSVEHQDHNGNTSQVPELFDVTIDVPKS